MLLTELLTYCLTWPVHIHNDLQIYGSRGFYYPSNYLLVYEDKGKDKGEVSSNDQQTLRQK